MLPSCSGVEGHGSLIPWCFMALSENQSVFAGVFDCAPFQWYLTKSITKSLNIREHDFGDGLNKALQSNAGVA